MKNILIVCTANKTRSPLAMELANDIANRRSLPYCFKSAGIAVIGSSIDKNVRRVLEEINIESDYTPTHIDDYNIESFDEIHVMTQRQKITLCSYFREKNIESRIVVLGIDDPFSQGIDAYRDCRDRLKKFYEAYIV